MADRKITDLTALAAGSQATGDLLTIVDVSESAAADKNKKITVENLLKGIPSNVGIATTSPSAPLAFGKSDYGEPSSENFYRIKFKDNGGTENDVGIGMPNASSLGFNSVSNGSIRFYTGTDGESMRIDDSGRLLVGTTTEGAANADNLTIADSGHAGMTIRSGTSSLGGLYFSDGTSGAAEYQGVVEYNHSTNALVLFANAAEGLRIDNSQNIGIGVAPSAWGGSRNAIQFDSAGAAYLCNDSTMGIASNFYFDGSTNRYINAGSASALYVQNDNIVFQFAGSGSDGASASFNTRVRIDNDGLKFGTDTAAANALDDYETGTWTPQIYGSNSNPSLTYSSQSGAYEKIGNLVHASFFLNISAVSSQGNGQFWLFGLPFNSVSSPLGASEVPAVCLQTEPFQDGDGDHRHQTFRTTGDNNFLLATYKDQSSGGAAVPTNAAANVGTGYLIGHITYRTNS